MTDHEPITVTLADGRGLKIFDWSLTRGDRAEMVPDEVMVYDASWTGPGCQQTVVEEDELDAIMDGPEYDAILEAICRAEDARLADVMPDDGEGL